ncbi:hypothetical protein DL96DRAFT_1277320 [Flagelloscypha sp. PMI_526]|nr:hypothetical protein DL96DRAFT_1277320 [Flagelloscypha sp. PMI_526]
MLRGARRFSKCLRSASISPVQERRYSTQHRTLLPIIRSANNLQLPLGPWDALNRKFLLSFKTDDTWSTSFGREGFEADPRVEEVVPFFVGDGQEPVGFLRTAVFDALQETTSDSQFWDIGSSFVRFGPTMNSLKEAVPSRSNIIDALVKGWRAEGRFRDILGKETKEHFPVFASKLGFGELLQFTIERPALPLFGLPNYGSMLIAYFTCPETKELKMWIPRRSMAKRTFPGMLDVTVGGGIAHGCSPLSTIIQEAREEAHLEEHYVQQRISSTGTVEFQYRHPDGWILPGVYFTFELEMDPPSLSGIQPRPNDGEVESFELMDATAVLDNLLAGKFKGSSALAIIQFLSRRGLLPPFQQQFV